MQTFDTTTPHTSWAKPLISFSDANFLSTTAKVNEYISDADFLSMPQTT